MPPRATCAAAAHKRLPRDRTPTKSSCRGASRGGLRQVLDAVLQPLRLGQGLELLQRVVLDLANPFACDAERTSDLFQRAGLGAAKAEPKLDHLPLAFRQRRQ